MKEKSQPIAAASEDGEVLRLLYQEHCSWERHHEEQRASVCNLLIAVAAGVLGLATFDQKLNRADLPLAVFLVFQGVFGVVFVAKHYERFCQHQLRATAYREALDAAYPHLHIKALRDEADKTNASKFPILHKLRLHWFWMGLHFAIATFGVFLVCGILLKWFESPTPSR